MNLKNIDFKKSIFFLGIVLFFFIECRNQEKNDEINKNFLFKELNKINPRIGFKDWKITKIDTLYPFYTFYAFKNDNAGVIFLNFSYFKKSETYGFEEDFFSINEYRQSWEDDGYVYVKDLTRESSYIYRYPANDPNQKEFIIGKYYYLYEKHLLSEGQKLFFKKYADSLVLIEGDKLPELPSIKLK